MHGQKFSSRKPGGLVGSVRRSLADGTVGQGAMTHSRHARHRGVGRSRSTFEAGEQNRNIGGGVRGGKGIDQGNCQSNGLVPDTELEQTRCLFGWQRHVTLYGQRTVLPKVGAVRRSSARTELCGGWLERAIPTATPDNKTPYMDLPPGRSRLWIKRPVSWSS